MNSIYDAENLQSGFVPVVYGYYDRANMMESTPEVINHSHSLCEIMYVNEGTMSIETESNGFNQVSCNQFILIDAGIRHWDLRFNKGLCSMMNIEFQYEEGTGLAPDLASLLKADGKLPYNLPASMAAVERHAEDDIRGPEPYVCKDGTVWKA